MNMAYKMNAMTVTAAERATPTKFIGGRQTGNATPNDAPIHLMIRSRATIRRRQNIAKRNCVSAKPRTAIIEARAEVKVCHLLRRIAVDLNIEIPIAKVTVTYRPTNLMTIAHKNKRAGATPVIRRKKRDEQLNRGSCRDKSDRSAHGSDGSTRCAKPGGDPDGDPSDDSSGDGKRNRNKSGVAKKDTAPLTVAEKPEQKADARKASKLHMKPPKLNGSGSVDTLLPQFVVCAEYSFPSMLIGGYGWTVASGQL